ncbi:MAG: hypothetical protein ABJN95_10160 [Maribacter sp.]|uniref:hypothetical protein n=1 Tax=Maribacter sp. TaxID=1897614 RepID=UPI00329A30D3
MTKFGKHKQTAQEKYNFFLSDYLEKNLFETGINLNQKLVENFNVSIDNARQIVKRAVSRKAIKSSAPYTFGKKQYIYIFNGFDLDKSSIKSISKKNRPPIFRLLEMMDLNGGIISYYEALKITASPLEESSTKVSSLDDILNLLYKLEMVYTTKDLNNVVYILYKESQNLSKVSKNSLMSTHYSKMVMDCSVLPDILRWLGKTNLIINSNVIYRNRKSPAIGAKHNNLVWDAFAYTKTTGINPILGSKADNIEKQTLVVLDVVLAMEYSQTHLDAFYNRIQINRKSVLYSDRKIMPIVIYRSASDLIKNKIRRLGLLSFEVSDIFGKRIYDILKKTQELSNIFKSSDKVDVTIEKLLNSINSAGQEDALKELRGTLFEFLMYPLLSNMYPVATIQRGRIISRLNNNGDKEAYEYDYIINSSNPPEIIVVELKGYHSKATIPLGDDKTKASLNWFFRRTLPFAVKEFKNEIGQGKIAKGVFITSANFWSDGKEFLKQLDKGTYKSVVMNTGYERDTLIALLKERGFMNEIRIIEKFYSKKE